MLTNSTLKQTVLVGFVVCVLAAACSSNDGRGDQLVSPDTTVAETTTSDAPSTTVDDTSTTADTSTVAETTSPPVDDGHGHTHDEPVATYPVVEVADTTTTVVVEVQVADITEDEIDDLPPLVRDLFFPEPVVITAPTTTSAAPTTPTTTSDSGEPEPQSATPVEPTPTTIPTEPISEATSTYTPEGNWGEDAPPPPVLAASDLVRLEPGMTLHFKTVPTWPEWNLESVLEGAVISQIILLENPPRQALASVWREWSGG